MGNINRILGASVLALSIPFALATAASAAVIYQNDFETGEIGASSECTGTDFLLNYRGCFSAVSPEVAGGGSGNLTAYAQPGQVGSDGSFFPGSTASFTTDPLPDLYSGRYEFTFEGVGIRELRFAEGFAPILVQEEQEGPSPFPFQPSGTGLEIDGNAYTVLFDLDVRREFYEENNLGDFAQQAFCGIEEPPTQCVFRFTFAVEEGGWIDNVQLTQLDGDSISVPEPATGAMLLVGLVAAGTMMRRSGRSEGTSA